jgi:hypothetical protein
MSELALYCHCLGDAVDLIAVYSQYTSCTGLPHLIAYVGGSPDGRRWRAERVLLERTPDESVALVTEMGDWSTGHTFARSSEAAEYRPAQRRIVDPVDFRVDDRIYDLVNHWVYWDNSILRLKKENVDAGLSTGLAQSGPVDASTVAELRSIWLISMPGSS